MLKFPVIIAAFAAVSVCSLAAQAQRLPDPNGQPSSAAEALSEPVMDPIRNAPAGREPLMVPSSAAQLQASSSSMMDACHDKLFITAGTIDSWQDGMRKENAIKELQGARVAYLASDPRTCDAHLEQALKE